MHRNLFLSHWLYHRKDTHTHTFCLVLVPLPYYFPSKHLEQGQILWHLSTLCASTFLSTTRICNRANGWDKKPLSSYRCLALADQVDLQVTFDSVTLCVTLCSIEQKPASHLLQSWLSSCYVQVEWDFCENAGKWNVRHEVDEHERVFFYFILVLSTNIQV